MVSFQILLPDLRSYLTGPFAFIVWRMIRIQTKFYAFPCVVKDAEYSRAFS